MRKDMTVEYGENSIRVADPVVNGVIKASSTSVSLPCDAVDGDVLITLDVNGTAVAHRELFKMVEGTVTVGDYTVAYESGAVTISTTSNNDVVSICIEPVEVVVSDAFRAAVGEAAPTELPPVTESDKGNYLHVNAETGKAEWDDLSGNINEAVADWLDDHPDATTTVEDGAISKAKLATDLNDMVDTTLGVAGTTVTGSYVNGNTGNIESNATYSYIRFPVIAGAVLYYKTKTNEGAPGLAFYTDGWTFLSGVVTNGTEKRLTVPENAAYACASYQTAEESYFYVRMILPDELLVKTLSDHERTVSDINTYYKTVDVGELISNTYINGSGNEQSSNGARATDYLPVAPGFKLKIVNAYIVGARSICAYDADKVFISGSAVNGSTSTTVEYSIPDDAAYIRATVSGTNAPTITYMDVGGAIWQLVEEQADLKGDIAEIENNWGGIIIEDGAPWS